MKFIYFSLFSLFSMAKGESLCLSYSKCREQLLARRWLCAEDARRATEHPCHLLDDLQSIWKASLWREKVLFRCLSTATEFSLDTNECPPEVSSMTLESPLESPLECGLAMVLHEERCERLQNCCPEEARCLSETLDLPGSRQLYRRRQSAASRATSCRRRMFAAIHSGLTREDISIATVVAQHTGTVLNLLSKMAAEDRKYKMQNQTAVSHATSTLPPFFKLSKNKVLNETAVSETSSALPPFFRLNKNKVLNETAVSETSSRLPPFFRLSKHKEKHEVDLRATSPTLPHFFKLDKNKSHHPPKTAGVPSKQLKHIQVLSVDNHVDSLKVQASGFIQQSSSGYLQQSSTRWTKHKPTIRRPWSNKKVTSTGKRRKVKTLFTKFLSSKTRPIKAWRPQAQPLPGLFLVKQNTSRSIGSFHQSQWKDENLAREEINRLKKERASLKQVDSEEVRTEPEVKQPVASEEDFAKEFERKAGSLVSIGQNAIPLPGSRHPDRVDSHRVEDPLIDVAERAELRPADVSDLVRTTKAPVMRPRLRLTSAPLEGPVFAFTTPNPLWNPLLAFFSTPSPLYLSTHQPIQLWPFRKRRRKLHGAKIFLGEEASPIVSRNILPIPKEDKNNCVKLQECFTKLDEREKNCTTQSTKNGISTKKTSFCENLNWKFRIEELFKSLDVDFRTCVLKSDVENENMKECAVPPELPEEVYEKKDCHRNIVQMRQYCDQLANCCPIAQRCRSTVDNSQSAADLRLRQRRLAMIAANCEKSNSIKGSIKMKKKWLKIRDEAQH